MRIWTPLPPSRSGIAHYSATVFDDPAIGASFVTEEAIPPDEMSDGDCLQLGNNLYHEFIFRRAQVGGGILELHDFSVHHLLTELTLARDDKAGYLTYLEAAYGALGRRMAMGRLRGRFHPRLEFLLPANGPLVAKARAVIVHSAWAAARLRLDFPDKPIYRVPHFCLMPTEAATSHEDRSSARKALGIEPGELVVLCAGFVTPPKKVKQTLIAAEAAAAAGARIRLVIGGSMDDPETEERAARSPLGSRLMVTGYLSDADLNTYMLASDIVPVMRFPSAGESSGIACRALGFGKLLIVPDYMGFTEFPEHTCLRLPLGEGMTGRLTEIFKSAAETPDAFADRRAAGESYARTVASLPTVRALYASIFQKERCDVA